MRTLGTSLRPACTLLIVAAAALLAPAALRAQADTSSGAAISSLPEAFAAASRAIAAGDHERARLALRAALAIAPNEPIVLYHLARAEAMTGQSRAALETLERLTTHGVARDVMADTAFAALRVGSDAARFRALADRLRAAAVPVVRSDTAFPVGADFIPEGIAHDPARDELYVGSLHGGGVLRVPRGGVPESFLAGGRHGLEQVLGMRVDAARRRLWVASLTPDSAAPRTRDGGGWAALHAYDLRDGRLVGRYPAPDSTRAHLLNDMAIAPNGDVYVTDSEGRALYRLRSGARELELVHGRAEDFTYPNGIAVGRDGRWLYVAHGEGLSAFELRGASTGRPVRMATPPGVSAGGIDGLYACGDGLVAVQSLFDFQQVTRFRLSDDGRRVVGAEALERRHPAYEGNYATTGAIAGDTLFYIGKSNLIRLQPDGSLADAGATPSVVLRLPLDGACDAPPAAPGR